MARVWGDHQRNNVHIKCNRNLPQGTPVKTQTDRHVGNRICVRLDHVFRRTQEHTLHCRYKFQLILMIEVVLVIK